jgi:tetratricopeptide (TPR) repeat protein
MRRTRGPHSKDHAWCEHLARNLAGFVLAISINGAAVPHAMAGTPVQDRNAAERSLLQGKVDESVELLQRIVALNPKDGQAYLLLCRAFYSEDHAEEAIASCESAVRLLPRNSEAQDWMGRAYGQKAENAGPLEGFKLARKVHSAFESAVAFDPNNGAAVNDLSEYYVNAPSIVGGGLDKADALANVSAARLAQNAHRIRALAAEKRKDYGRAEEEFQAAVDVAKRPDAWADLGGFLARRKETDRSVEALRHALAADRAKDASVVDAASILNEMHVEAKLAMATLQQYLAGNAKSDAAPAAKVHVILGRMMSDAGDAAGADAEFHKALELASNYAPAQRALQHKERSK